MVGISFLGLVVAALGTYFGVRLIDQLETTTSDTSAVTIETLAAVDDTLELTEITVASTGDALSSIERTLDGVAEAIGSTDEIAEDLVSLTDRAGPAFGSATESLRQLALVGEDIDVVLAALSSIPFGPDYAPASGLGETFESLAADIEPLASAFESTSESVAGLSGDLDDVLRDVRSVADDVGTVNDALAGAGELIDRYQRNVAEARAVAERADADLEHGVDATRLIIIFAGINFAAGQIVPLWYGLELRARPPDHGLSWFEPMGDRRAMR